MRFLVCGARGFVGRHISHRLQQAGHEIVYGVHQFSDGGTVQHNELLIDYHKDTSTSIWEKRFAALAASGKIDIVINAVGILTASNTASFAAIHRDTPIALFQAASDAGVRGILQISALGPDDSTLSQTASASQELSCYLQTKRNTDQYLSQLNCTNLILRPSLIVGMDGGSSQLFRSLASMPVIALPGKGEQALQPVHIDDLCRCVEKWVEEVANNTAAPHQIICAVGPSPMTYRDMLTNYRQAMRLAPSWFIPIPMSVMRLSAELARFLPQKVFAPETLRMLEQGNTADATQFIDYLGQAPKGAKDWFSDHDTANLAAAAIATWSTILFRLALAFLWIATGIISLWIYPHQESALLLSQVGISSVYTMPILYAASGLDLSIGIATITHPSRRLWLAQLLVIFMYSIIIGVCLPEFLIHPFGPILKNIPILAILLVLIGGEKK